MQIALHRIKRVVTESFWTVDIPPWKTSLSSRSNASVWNYKNC